MAEIRERLGLCGVGIVDERVRVSACSLPRIPT